MKVKDLPLEISRQMEEQQEYEVEFFKIIYRIRRSNNEIVLGDLNYKKDRVRNGRRIR